MTSVSVDLSVKRDGRFAQRVLSLLSTPLIPRCTAARKKSSNNCISDVIILRITATFERVSP